MSQALRRACAELELTPGGEELLVDHLAARIAECDTTIARTRRARQRSEKVCAVLEREMSRRAAIDAEMRALERSGFSHRALASLFERLSPAEARSRLNDMLASSADDGDVEGMVRYRALGAVDFDKALCSAASRGREAVMFLCSGWGARDFNEALASAAGCDELSAMHLCREWGATDFEGALRSAVECGAIKGMKLCREWGAKNFQAALDESGGINDEASALLASWIAGGAD